MVLCICYWSDCLFDVVLVIFGSKRGGGVMICRSCLRCFVFVIVCVVGLMFVSEVSGCLICKEGLVGVDYDGLVEGFYWSILFMMLMFFIIFGGLVIFFYFVICRVCVVEVFNFVEL